MGGLIKSASVDPKPSHKWRHCWPQWELWEDHFSCYQEISWNCNLPPLKSHPLRLLPPALFPVATVPRTPAEVVASERRGEKQMKDRDVGRNLWHWHTGGALCPSFWMVLSPVLALPDVSVPLTSARVGPGTRRDKDKMKNALHWCSQGIQHMLSFGTVRWTVLWEVPFRDSCISVALKSFEHVLSSAFLFLD